MHRAILHLEIRGFLVAIERLKNSRLNEKPIIIGGLNTRALVMACSAEANAYGIYPSMPIKQAKAICPEALFIKADPDAYLYHAQIIRDIIAEASPLYEQGGLNEFYIDLTGLEKYFGL